MILTLPIPPTVNHYWVRAKTGAVYLTPKAKRYKKQVRTTYLGHRPKHWTHKTTARIRIDIDLHFADRRTNDIDNRIKGLFDALSYAGVWADDSQVDVMVVCRRNVVKGGKCVIRISEIKVIEL